MSIYNCLASVLQFLHKSIYRNKVVLNLKHLPVFLAMFSNRRGYLVSLCISMGIISFSCSLRHCGLLSASYNTNTEYLLEDILRCQASRNDFYLSQYIYVKKVF